MIKFLLKRRNVRKATDFFNSDKGLKVIPYGWGSRLISWFCATDFAHDEFFKKRLPAFNEFLEQIKDKQDKRRAATEFLTVNFLHGWRTSSLTHLGNRAYRKYVKFSGLDHFLKQYSLGKGVVVIGSHFGFPGFSLSLFPRIGYRDFYSILGEKGPETMKFSGIRADSRPNLLLVKRGSSSDMFRILMKAREVLESGGILHILGDGQHGRSSFSLPFLGKMRGFRASFAELALSSGAALVPVFILPLKKGKVLVEFHEALDCGNDAMEHEEKLKLIVQQYAALLERKWRKKPQYVNGGFVDVHIRQVEAG
ncbi:MAG: lysophospholipid acyltransferase family protein [Bacteroidetes bacterium]|nr:lysophospholipid acyltransferase family protein [Bacteroidota bacterium]